MNPLRYTLAKVNLIRLSCPVELQATIQNRCDGLPLVVAANKKRLGAVSGYVPPLVVKAGESMRRALMAVGVVKAWAWVAPNAKGLINADDAISCGELMDRLSALLVAKFYGRNQPIMAQPSPYILQVYPFENYLIYQMKGEKYRQGYNVDPVARECVLYGPSQRVEEKFVNAMGDTKQFMPRVQTGVRYAYAPPMGNTQSMTQGGKNSELVLCIIRNWTNVNEAAAAYVNATKTGLKKQMRPAFYPVDLSDDGKILAGLTAQGIDPYEFARWSFDAQKKYQTRDGKKLGKSKFAYTPSNDPSSWKLPIDTPGRKRNALARINQTQGVKNKGAVLNKIRKSAKQSGIDVSDKATGKQKKWIKSQVPGRVPSGGMANIVP
jgi:hypothetical protein